LAATAREWLEKVEKSGFEVDLTRPLALYASLGGDITLKSPRYGITLLHLAAFNFMGDPTAIRALVKAGADVHARTNDGTLPRDWGWGFHKKTLQLLFDQIEAEQKAKAEGEAAPATAAPAP